MGAWGVDSFENDDACDWLDEFCESPRFELISEALEAIAQTTEEDYLESPDCCNAIAAAEVLASLKGAPNPNIDASRRECFEHLKAGLDITMFSLALQALKRIKENSELKELFDESDSASEWYSSVNNLEKRLRP